MSDDILVFEKINVQKAAGFRPPGFEVDGLSPGINIIYGPNASGKTTLARAIRALLWPKSPGLDRAMLEGNLRSKEIGWRVELDGKHINLQRDGVGTKSGPLIPPVETRDRYYLCLHELLEAENENFARIIMQESVGGYDVDDAANSLGFREPSLRRGNSTKEVDKLKKERAAALSKQQALQGEEQQLRSLEEDRKRCDEARYEANIIARVIDFQLADLERDAASQKLKSFPDVLQYFRGDEEEFLKARRTQISDARLEEERAQKSWDIEQISIEKSDIPDEGLPRELRSILGSYLSELDTLDSTRRELVRTVESAKEARDNARNILGQREQYRDVKEIDAEVINNLSALAREADGVRSDLNAHDALKSLLEDEAIVEDGEETRTGIGLLQKWLRSPSPGSEGRPEEQKSESTRLIILICAILAGGAGLVLTLTVHLVWMTIFIITALLIWAFITLKKAPISGVEDHRSVYRQDFEKLAIEMPGAWTEDIIEAHVHELLKSNAAAVVQAEKARELASHSRKFEEHKKKKRALDEKCTILASTLGIELVGPMQKEPAQLYWLVSQLQQWQSAYLKASEKEEELTQVESEVETTLKKVGELLTPFGYEAPLDRVEAQAQVDSLEEAAREVENSRRTQAAAREKKSAAQGRREKAEGELTTFFERLRLKPDEDDKVIRLSDKLDEYKLAAQYFRDKEAAAAREEENLKEHFSEAETFLNETISALEQRCEDLHKESEQRDEVIKGIQDIQTRIDAAKKSTGVEEKWAKYESALENLRREREQTYEQVVGHELAEFLKEETRDGDRPKVFHRASKIFGEITSGRYRLDLDSKESPQFLAIDSLSGVGQNLNELSSGTRVQLLLAIRLAFVERQESGAKLPLILDETLANSDDLRAHAIMEAIEKISLSGRQVFYLTAQSDEVNKWRALLNNSAVPHRFISLEAAKGEVESNQYHGPESLPPAPKELPDPADLTHADYGKALAIQTRLDPFAPANSVHLWFLVEDLDTLHRLLQKGVNAWGKLENLSRQGSLELVGLSNSQFRKIAARHKVISALNRAWKIGRGRQVTSAALMESGAVTDSFIERVIALNESLNGDAQELLEALDEGKISRFRSDKLEELEEYFHAQGYLDPDRTLNRDEIWLRILTASSKDIEQGIIDEAIIRRLQARAVGEGMESGEGVLLGV